MRINKFISESGICSRRKAEEYIKEGRVQINGYTVSSLSKLINPDKDKVTVDGELIKPEKRVYFLMNKPAGYITTTEDEQGRKTVLDLLMKVREKVFPVGRLDYNTTGVLILTNDGDFANAILHPSKKIRREYTVKIHRPLTSEDEAQMMKGYTIEGKRGKFVAMKTLNKERTSVSVVSEEGRNHFVKLMFKARGYFVEKLHRSKFGPFDVKRMPEGAYRIVSEEEIKEFYCEYRK